MTNPLYDQLLKAIKKHCSVEGSEYTAKACQTISEEWAKGFAEWIKKHCEAVGTNRWYYWKDPHDRKAYASATTDQLLQLYKNSEHGKH